MKIAKGIAKHIDRESVMIVLIGLFLGGLIAMWIIQRTDPTLAAAVEARPYHGRLIVSTSKARVAPFKIVTPEGTRGYLVKLVDTSNGETALSVFLEAGQTYETNAPLGSYAFRWASGREWVNDARLFGSLTEMQEAYEPLVFREDGRGGYSGHTIELEPRIDGNLYSDRVSPSNF